jgi:hypothetical protein
VVKLADRYTRGLPDLLIGFRISDYQGNVLFVETKAKGGKLKRIQREQHIKLAIAHCNILIVAEDDDDPIALVLTALSNLGAQP